MAIRQSAGRPAREAPPGRPDRVGLGGLLGSELQSAFARGLAVVAAPWWVAEHSGHVLAGAVVALAMASGWTLGSTKLAERLRNLPAGRLSWIADCTVALTLALVLIIEISPSGTVAAATVLALLLTALQRWAPSARSRLVEPLAADAHLDPLLAQRWLVVLRVWLPWVGAMSGVSIAALLSATVAMWVCFGLFLQAGEFVFVAVLSAPGLSRAEAA